MPSFTGHLSIATPSTSADNYTLVADTAGDTCRVRWVAWGGEVTASAAMRTRWTRPTTAGTGALTAITPGSQDPLYNTAACSLGSAYATTPGTLPTPPAGALYLTSWNAHGGLGVMQLPPGTEWIVTNGLLPASGGGALSCRNDQGTSLSSYGICWEE